ncbi:MAG: hypothetical protein JXA57_19615 [Armatimonadetes bacterium]|nr:hypothetical protein [Armatimonadota bacterium]
MSWLTKMWSTFGDILSQESWGPGDGPTDPIGYTHFLEQFGDAAYRPDGRLKRPEDFTDPRNGELAALVWYSGKLPEQTRGSREREGSAAVAFSTPSSAEGRGGGFSISPERARAEAEARCREEYEREVAEWQRWLKLAKAGPFLYNMGEEMSKTRIESTGTGESVSIPPSAMGDPNAPGNRYYGTTATAEAVYEERVAQALEKYKKCMQDACQLPSNSAGGGGGGGAR